MLIGTYLEIVLAELQRDMTAHGLENTLPESIFAEREPALSFDISAARKAILEDGKVGQRLSQVYSLLGNKTAARLFDLCCICLVNPELKSILGEHLFGCSLETCVALTGEEPDFTALSAEYDLAKLVLLSDGDVGSLARRRFSADDYLLCFLEGSLVPDKSLNMTSLLAAEEELQQLYIEKEYVEELKRALKTPDALVQITAECGRGRRLLLSHACRELGMTCLAVDVERLAVMTEERRLAAVMHLRREMLLHSHVLCYHGLENVKDWALKDFLRECVYCMPHLEKPICICTSEKTMLIEAANNLVNKIALPRLTRSEHIALWKGYCEQYAIPEVDCFTIGSKYKLSPLQIKKTAQRLAVIHAEGRKVDEETVSEVCIDVMPPAEGNIRRVKVSYTIDDLVLLPDQLKVLNSICAHVKYKMLVYDQWDMESRFSYGRNVSALFVGAPGTGKTMAVHVLSNMLHLPLYHVDLSQVVDKYIGETEKRLEEIFDVAEKSNTILFFDEADGIFGKRSEVSDSKDKHANTQASYILQRIEQYDGMVILATNFNKNIDEAFKRRIRYLVEFQKPPEELRLRLWKGSFSPKTPLQKVDFPYLAKTFELTGGAIKNIALNAAFLAAEDSSPITMKHILTSLREENRKLGKTMLKQDLTEYSMLF